MPRPHPSKRLLSIDALRGLATLHMLHDHIRMDFFAHHSITDPMDVNIDPFLYLIRSVSHICAPTFIFLAGLSAMLVHQKTGQRRPVSTFLVQRGLILVLLDATLVQLAVIGIPIWAIGLRVITALGLCMIALSGLLWLPKLHLLQVSLIIVAGHNLLDSVKLRPGSFPGFLWALLHHMDDVSFGPFRIQIWYPVLPWIGVISLGYLAGVLYQKDIQPTTRLAWIRSLSLSALVIFFLLRGINYYGDKPWKPGQTYIRTLMSFFNLTKYPPSLLFILWTLGITLALLGWLEQLQEKKFVVVLAQFGSAPMFMYLLHRYVLKFMYFAAEAFWGQNQGKRFGFPQMWQVTLCAVVLAFVLFWPVRAFAKFKARRRDITWLKYF